MSSFARLRAFLRIASLALLAGCGGSTDDSTPATGASTCADASGCSMAYVAMTDADGDFLNYALDVLSLKLTRANGTVVETLPASARVDFAEYVDLTEFLTAASIPNGTYVEGTLRLDYTNASITVEKNGQPAAARAVDANGAALGVVDVRVVLDNRHRLVVAPGRPALLTLDFNLAATNVVDLTTTPATVTARPTLIASLEPVETKELRLRGPVVSVDTVASTYTIDVRPFNHPAARHGRIAVHTNSTTTFEINGQAVTGAVGLQALATAGTGTASVAFGTLTVVDRTFVAERVHAGTSVPGQGVDTVIGTIVARNGNELTVRGGTIVRTLETNAAATIRDDRATFDRGAIKVVVGANTVVLKDGAGVQTNGAQNLSVGQSIQAYGAVTQVAGVNSLDATQGRVRMHLSHLFGTVVSNNPGLLTLNLAAINARPIAIFNFAGTGQVSAQDASPANYEVQTPLVTSLQLTNGRIARVFGYVTPFGAAPPDFQSRTLVSYAELRAQLAIGFGVAGSAAPFNSLNASGLILNLADPNIGLPHHIHVGPTTFDLQSLTASPTILGASGGATMYVIVTTTGIMHYAAFADFVAALTTSLNGSSRLVGFSASGYFDSNANTLTASAAAAILK
ncbi:MAG TPA: hypothetical protein VK629_07595 [Steroidobacteraceae bacterium]|nr:hypothetical protein [Steroidobacteraceae bacterium]